MAADIITRRIFISHAWPPKLPSSAANDGLPPTPPPEPGLEHDQIDHARVLALLGHVGIDPERHDPMTSGWIALPEVIELEDGRRVQLEIFYDDTSILPLAKLPDTLRKYIGESHVLAACWSERYPTRAACMWEYISAFFAGGAAVEPGLRAWVLPTDRERVQSSLRPKEAIQGRLLGDLKVPANRTPTDHYARIWLGLATAAADHKDPIATLPALAPKNIGWTPKNFTHFVGRQKELWAIYEALHESGMTGAAEITGTARAEAGNRQALTLGLGGIGKSMLAQVYAQRFAGAYPGGVFWLRAFGHDDVKGPIGAAERSAERGRQLRDLMGELEIPLPEKADDGQVRQLLKSHLAAGQPYLWIVDDLPSNPEPADKVHAWLAPSHNGHTLMTSRSRAVEGLGKEIRLDVLPADAAFALLTVRRVPANNEERAAAEAICEALGHHPLALEVAGALTAKLGANACYGQLLGGLEQAPEAKLLQRFGGIKLQLPTGHEANILYTFQRSFEGLSPAGMILLQLASQLAASPIPVELVANVLESGNQDAMVAQMEVEQAGLAEVIGSTLSVHTLVAHAAVVGLETESRAVLRVAAQGRVLKEMPTAADIRRHQSLANWLPHAQSLVDETEPGLEVLGWLSRHDHEQGNYTEARRGYHKQWEAFARLLGSEHPDTLTSRGNLASTLFAQGDLSGARSHQEAVWEAETRLLGSEHPDTLTSRNNLASTLKAQGDLDGARSHQEAVWEALTRLLGSEHSRTLTSRNNLASTLRAQGDLDGARSHEEATWQAQARLLGTEHPDTLTSRLNLASTLFAQGDLSGARSHQEAVWEARARLLGSEHPDTLTSRNNLAQTLKAQGDLDGARSHEEAVWEARARLLGSEHPDTLTSRGNLASTLQVQGDLSGARSHEEAVWEALSRLLGSEHPDTLTSRNNLALTLKAQGDLDGARSHEEAVWEALSRLLGSEHPDTLTSRNNLALSLKAQGDLSRARSHLEAIWEARARRLGSEHPDTLTSRNNLASTLFAQGDLPGARSHLEAVWEARARRLGPRHSDTTGAAWNLFMTLLQMQAPEATEVFQSGLAWVLSVEPDLLSHQQQQIQAMLHQMNSQAR